MSPVVEMETRYREMVIEVPVPVVQMETRTALVQKELPDGTTTLVEIETEVPVHVVQLETRTIQVPRRLSDGETVYDDQEILVEVPLVRMEQRTIIVPEQVPAVHFETRTIQVPRTLPDGTMEYVDMEIQVPVGQQTVSGGTTTYGGAAKPLQPTKTTAPPMHAASHPPAVQTRKDTADPYKSRSYASSNGTVSPKGYAGGEARQHAQGCACTSM